MSVIIGIRVDVGYGPRAAITRRKYCKHKIWFKPEMFPLKNGQIVICCKTGNKYQIVKPDATVKKSKYPLEGYNR